MNDVVVALRAATADDCARLAVLNRHLIEDEKHRNPMSVAELESRMRRWLSTDYRGIVAQGSKDLLGYALFRNASDARIHLRQLFVVAEARRSGLGRRLVEAVECSAPTSDRLHVEVLCGNSGALAFWRSIGFRDYAVVLERTIQTNGLRS